ncbi:hypothetical protein PpBr36_09062 [Pyricularia pennisetigena]|uniref:hypothetical protein n=1 Tax=Pyricularia pennisetigena TaxID=1578925 RepID=UPI00114F8453|nr:hypothetical protein PpBr36_09062 [Pyricularia pennisetigena]TLS24320.1 hypothetical protein PpBr36_09062 [Pyricularia pennisetigena]
MRPTLSHFFQPKILDWGQDFPEPEEPLCTLVTLQAPQIQPQPSASQPRTALVLDEIRSNTRSEIHQLPLLNIPHSGVGVHGTIQSPTRKRLQRVVDGRPADRVLLSGDSGPLQRSGVPVRRPRNNLLAQRARHQHGLRLDPRAGVVVHGKWDLGVPDRQLTQIDFCVRDVVHREGAVAPGKVATLVVPVVEASDPAGDVVRGLAAHCALAGSYDVVPELDRVGRVRRVKGRHEASQDRSQARTIRGWVLAKSGEAVELGHEGFPVAPVTQQSDGGEPADDPALELEVGLGQAHHEHVGRHAVRVGRGGEVGHDPTLEPIRLDALLDLILEADDDGLPGPVLDENDLLSLRFGMGVHEKVHLGQDCEPHLFGPDDEVKVFAPCLDGASDETVRRGAQALFNREAGAVVRGEDDGAIEVDKVPFSALQEKVLAGKDDIRTNVWLGFSTGQDRYVSRDDAEANRGKECQGFECLCASHDVK